MLVFIDETGNHNFMTEEVEYPIFGLGALLISEKEYKKLDAAIKDIKKKFFIGEDFILHSSELKRPLDIRSDPRNQVMANKEFRVNFYKEFDEVIIKEIEFQIITCFIDKRNINKDYARSLASYDFTFENVLNQILKYGDDNNKIIVESRNNKMNTQLYATYEYLSKVGTKFYTNKIIKKKTKLKLISKKDNTNGLQVIDMILSCLARYKLGKEERMIGNDLDPNLLIIKGKGVAR